MKKSIILGAAVMAFSFAAPQVVKAIKVQNQNAFVQDKDDKFKEIKVTELPPEVTKSISTAYTGSKIDKAYLGEDNSYKVKVSMGELKYNLFYDAKGDLIKVEEPNASKVKSDMPEMDPSMKSTDPSMKSNDPSMKSTDPSMKSNDPANKSMEPSKKGTQTPNKTY